MTPRETVIACCLLVLPVLVLSACVSIDEHNREVEACNERIADAQAVIEDAHAIIDKTAAKCNEMIEGTRAVIDNGTEQCNPALEKTIMECNKLLDACSCDADACRCNASLLAY